ncbi:MAG: N-6 DNA methylase [Alphaproteobacteria bacterium]|nr:N-6 DNA methylase [Alphaproteobacteria bacterium]
MPDLPPLNGVGGAADPAGALHAAWHAILERDYAPVFVPALAVLDALPERRAVGHAVRTVAECANRVADSLSELGYDHAGPLYHRILGSAKSDGAFYTNNVSALMLARLALSEDFADWSDPEAVTRLRIMDPACGTGTLLMAAMQTIKARMSEASSTGDPAALHRRLVEDVLCGLDINRHAIQLAACNLTLGAPTVDYRRMNLFTLRHGPQADGGVRAGSLEILGAAGGPASLGSLAAPLRTLDELDAAQVDSAPEAAFPLENIDLIIMNPPFTEIVNQGSKFSRPVVVRMQQHQVSIRDRINHRDSEAGGAINHRSVRTFFTPLSEQLLRRQYGVLAMILPATACTGTAGLKERRFLARNFHIERIITSHDPKRVNFSENTDIHECLLVCRRNSESACLPTQFVSLRRMPSNADEGKEATDSIVFGKAGDWGSVCLWPSSRVETGDWTPVQWFDGALSEATFQIEQSGGLEAAGLRFKIGPIGQVVRVNFQECEDEFPDAVRVFYSVSAKLRRTMRGEPEAWRRPRPDKEAQAWRYWAQRSHLLVAQRFRTTNGLLTGLWSPEASIGSGWVPVAVESREVAQALAAWWNSTPARLMLLNRRSKTLDYPAWSLEQLREIRVPKPDNPAWGALKDAFEATCDEELMPMKQAEECAVRAVIDEAAALALGLSPDVLADWRRRLAAEPTISNRPAPGPDVA